MSYFDLPLTELERYSPALTVPDGPIDAVALFGETLSGTRVAGIALVVAGMVVGATRRREPEARNTHPANPDRPSRPAPTAQTATD